VSGGHLCEAEAPTEATAETAAVVEKLNEMTGLSIIADIGNGTVNIIFVSNKRVINTKTYTEKMGDSPRGGEMSRRGRGDGRRLGVNQCVKAASNAMMNKLGVTVDETIIQSMIRYGKADIDSEYADVLRQAISEHAEDIFALLRKYEYDPKMMRLYITGGGGKLIENFGNYDKDSVTIIGDSLITTEGEYAYTVRVHKDLLKMQPGGSYVIPISFRVKTGDSLFHSASGGCKYSNYKVTVSAALYSAISGNGISTASYDDDHIIYTNARVLTKVID